MANENLELFQRGLSVAQLAAQDREETGDARRAYLCGLIAGLAIALGETMSDGELHQALDQVADFATAWRKHHNARAN